jgi:hypothetical protein
MQSIRSAKGGPRMKSAGFGDETGGIESDGGFASIKGIEGVLLAPIRTRSIKVLVGPSTKPQI